MNTLTIGTFDLFHEGHENLLNECMALMCKVIVGVNSDGFVESFKRRPPVDDVSKRMTNVRRFGSGFAGGSLLVTTHQGMTPAFIKDYAPCYLVIGSDWGRKDYLKQLGVTWDWMDENGVRLLYIPYTPGISSTILRARLGE